MNIVITKKRVYDNKRTSILHALKACRNGDAVIANTKYELEQARMLCALYLHKKSVQQKQYSGGWLLYPIFEEEEKDKARE